MKRMLSGAVLIAALLLAGVGVIWAQGGGDADDVCPVFVEDALALVDESCAGLGIDEACYGHARVEAVFWSAEAADAFAAPSDRAPLRDVQTLTTAPLDLDAATWGLALLNLRADVPESLPGQGVLFLLMGDAVLENAVEPDEVVEPVAGVVLTGANVRSRPSANANLVGSLPAGEEIALTGVNADGDWFQLRLESGAYAWVWGELIDVTGDVDALTVVDPDAPRYGPMQAVYFSAGLGETTCQEAPNALVVQSPGGVEVTLSINDLAVTIGSSIVFAPTTVEIDGVTQDAMVVAVLDGFLRTEIGGEIVQFTRDAADEPIPAFAVTLNEEGGVDLDSVLTEVDPEAITPAVQASCSRIAEVGRVEAITAEVCEASVTFPPPAPPPTAIPPTPVPPTAVPGDDGGEGTAPTAAPPPDSGGGGQGTASHWFLVNFCTGVTNTSSDGIIRAGDQVTFAVGCCGAATLEEQLEQQASAGGGPYITLDGVPLPITITGPFVSPDDGWYTNDGRYVWTATPGGHTVTAAWGNYPADTCGFTVFEE